MSIQRKNVIMFVVDSARYYSTGGMDDRDKLKMMDKFERESIYFPTTVTSAPSSIMSLASMLTSLPAYYISRTYDDFKYDNNQFLSLHKVLIVYFLVVFLLLLKLDYIQRFNFKNFKDLLFR